MLIREKPEIMKKNKNATRIMHAPSMEFRLFETGAHAIPNQTNCLPENSDKISFDATMSRCNSQVF